MTTTFDGLVLKDASPEKPKMKGALHWEIEIECSTNDYTDITALSAKSGITKTKTLIGGETSAKTTGTKGTLVLEDGQTITNCAIMDGVQVEEVAGTGGTRWKYRVKFVKDYGA